MNNNDEQANSNPYRAGQSPTQSEHEDNYYRSDMDQTDAYDQDMNQAHSTRSDMERTDVYRPTSPTSPTSNPNYDDPHAYAADADGDDQQPQVGQMAGTYHQAHGMNMPPVNTPPYYGGNGMPPQPSTRSRGGLRSGAMVFLAIAVLIVLGVGLFGGYEFAHGNGSIAFNTSNAGNSGLQQSNNSNVQIPTLTGNNIDAVREAVIKKATPAVVQITVNTAQGQDLGSGVIIDKRGYIVTNNHVVAGATSIDSVTLFDGTKATGAKVVGTDPADDLAVIKINPPANITTLPLGNSSQVQVGQDVVVIGNPLGITQTVTSGIVSATNRVVQEDTTNIPNTIQTDAPINPGNSGGAMVNLQGQLIGIPTTTAVDPEFNTPANGVGFAIPSNRISFIANQLIATGTVQHTGRAALGIEEEDVTPQTQYQDNLAVSQGVLVAGFSSDSNAQKAGLQVGDVIVKVDGKTVTDGADLEDILQTMNIGQKVTLEVDRGSQQLSFTVALGELSSQVPTQNQQPQQPQLP
jgi:S1-C subfamily serine protease